MIYLVQNDTTPLDVTLDVDADLTGATVDFHMAQRSGDKLVVGACTVEDIEAKEVRYEWEAGDLDTPGVYNAEWQVTTSSGEVTVPNRKFEIVYVREEIA